MAIAKRVESEGSELTSSHEQTKIIIIYRATTYKIVQKTSRKYLPQLKIERRNHNETGRRGGHTVESRPTGWSVTHDGRIITVVEVLTKEQGV